MENVLIKKYNLLISNQDNFNKLYSSSKKNTYGNFYTLFSTNVRGLKTLSTYFNDFQRVIGIERKEWPKTKNAGQELHKQKISILEKCKLICNSSTPYITKFSLTKRGESFKNDLKIFNFKDWTKNEKYCFWFLYVLSYDNYSLLEKSQKIIENLSGYFQNYEEIEFQMLFFLKIPSNNIINYMNNDLFIFHSFFGFDDFLKSFFNSSKEIKNEFKNYLIQNFNNRNELCAIFKKYKTSGTFTKETLFDEFFICYIIKTLILEKSNYSWSYDENDIVETLFEKISAIFPIDKVKILSHINASENKWIYMIILEDAFKRESNFFITSKYANENYIEIEEDILKYKDIPELRIDDTYEYGRRQSQTIFIKRKDVVRKEAFYKCALEKIKNCSYFKSKKTNSNYVEVHHLIPRSYSQKFSNSIEVFSNYISLCPKCHRLIHQAVKTERDIVIRILFSERKERLKNTGLDIKENELLEMYT